MGVCFVGYSLTDSHIDEISADPLLIWRVVEPEDESVYLHAVEEAAKGSWFSKLVGKPTPTAIAITFSEHELRSVDLDKSWDGLNACLKSLVSDLPHFFDGSGSFGKIEVGYGPALFHHSEALAQFAARYCAISDSDLLAAFATVDLTKTYPKQLWMRRDEEAKSYLRENFIALKRFLDHTSTHSMGAVLQFT